MTPDSDFIGFRSSALKKRIKQLVDDNPGRITASEIIRTALEEKLDRLESDGVLNLRTPEKKKARRKAEPIDLGTTGEETAEPRHKRSSAG